MIQVNVISSITTGTENMENTKNETILYPNPSNGKFIIEATHAVNQSIQIFDLNGKLVLTKMPKTLPGATRYQNLITTSFWDGVATRFRSRTLLLICEVT